MRTGYEIIIERKEKTEKAPALYDLTTLQRDANRILGYTAQQTLDYLQSLYEKKLCTDRSSVSISAEQNCLKTGFILWSTSGSKMTMETT